jgi:GH35 family endo-1,4-beta-xylanase
MRRLVKHKPLNVLSYAVLAVCITLLSSKAFALTVEAENAAIKTCGEPIAGGWNLWSNGTVGEYFRIKTAGLYEVTVYASGTPLRAVWPIMALSVDSLARETKIIDTSEFTDYVFQAELTPGVHSIGVTFLNDACNPGVEDRNLYLDKIEIRSAQGLEEPVLSSEEEWVLEAKSREDAVLQKIDVAIKKNRMGSGTITVLDEEGNPVSGVSVAIEQTQHDFLFGCNIFMFDKFNTEEKNTTYKQRFRELFNYVTVPFYWRSFEPEQGKLRYQYMDKVVAWCREKGIRLKGHPLLWDREGGIPPWSDGQPSPEAQRKHVTEIMQRYEGKIEFWEVVNEPAHLDGIPINNPYRWAREASSEAYLIVNDYFVFANGYPPFFELLEEATRDGVPFDGIGIQAHEPKDEAFPLDRIQAILNMYANLGQDLHVTEFTPSSNGQTVIGSPWRGTWNEAQQADYAEKFYRVCFAHPAVIGITWWDFCDQDSWRENGGMLRSDLSPKPVYETLKRVIHEEWHTRLQGKTDASGGFPFSGFYGLYRLTLELHGFSKEAEFHIVKGGSNDFTLKLEFKGISPPANMRILPIKCDTGA